MKRPTVLMGAKPQRAVLLSTLGKARFCRGLTIKFHGISSLWRRPADMGLAGQSFCMGGDKMLPFGHVPQQGQAPPGAVVMPKNNPARQENEDHEDDDLLEPEALISAKEESPLSEGERRICASKIVKNFMDNEGSATIDTVTSRIFEHELETLPERLELARRELYKKYTAASWEELGFK